MLTAGYVDAAEAERIGLLNHAVPSDELDAAVAGITEAIGDTGREAVKASKRAINDATEAPDLESARAHEAELWWEQFATEERRDLVEAFNED
jgi:enoyl-CoA hydratase/carnithine racemase